jgi:Histidyl-tRNA synthetase
MAKLAAPSGFRDFLPDEHRKRQELIGRIRASYESFGFEGMDTPAMENLQVFLGKGGGENEKLMFRVLKRGAEPERAIAARCPPSSSATRSDPSGARNVPSTAAFVSSCSATSTCWGRPRRRSRPR